MLQDHDAEATVRTVWLPDGWRQPDRHPGVTLSGLPMHYSNRTAARFTNALARHNGLWCIVDIRHDWRQRTKDQFGMMHHMPPWLKVTPLLTGIFIKHVPFHTVAFQHGVQVGWKILKVRQCFKERWWNPGMFRLTGSGSGKTGNFWGQKNGGGILDALNMACK